MNIVYLRYAITIAKAGSLNKAAEELFIAQPNLSRAVKELERELGITIFDRNSRGITLTADGERLIAKGKQILAEIDALKDDFNGRRDRRTVFSVSAPRADYIADAFAAFSSAFGAEERCEVFFKETGALQAITNIVDKAYKLGIVRYPFSSDKYFKETFEAKGLAWELIAEFHHVIVIRKDCPLNELDEIRSSDLENYIEVVYPDSFVPFTTFSVSGKEEKRDGVNRRISVYDRASLFDIVSTNYEAYAWASPVSNESLEKYGLVQRSCFDDTEAYRDVLVYPREYKLSDLDKSFMTELCRFKRKTLG